MCVCVWGGWIPSTMWGPGVELKSSGLVASDFMCWAIFMFYRPSFLCQLLSATGSLANAQLLPHPAQNETKKTRGVCGPETEMELDADFPSPGLWLLHPESRHLL